MNEMQVLFEIEKKFSGCEKNIAISIFVYYFFVFAFERYRSLQEFFFAVLTIAVLMIDYYIGKKKYWNRRYVIRICKQVVLFTASVAMVYNIGIYLSVTIMTLVYVAVVVQYFFIFDISENYYRISAVIEITLPLTLVTFTYYMMAGKSNFEVFLVLTFIITWVIIITSDLKVISEITNKLLNEMFRRERIAINSHKEYENLKLYQAKLVHANEQLSIQKFQMEQLNEKINNRNRQMDLQYKILKHITGALDIEKLIEFIVSEIIDNIKVDLCIICVSKHDENEGNSFHNIKYSTAANLHDDTIDKFSEYIQSEQYEDFAGECIVDNNIEPGEYPFLTGSRINSILIYPINNSENIKGVIAVGDCSARYFTDTNKDFYKGIVEQIILAVNNASMYRMMQEMATKDPLTSIFNRRHFNAIFPKYVEEVSKNNQPLTLILFDIDKFKNVNDQYGHLFGDEVIKLCGMIGGKTAEENGGVAVRYGGEEFVLVFPDKNVDKVYGIVEKMHKEIKEYEFTFEGKPVFINVSIGIASYPETCTDLGELLNRADLAMYHSKNTGRGRITIDSPKSRGEE